MKRVETNEQWTLFDPYIAKGLTELYGEEFEKRYIELENDENIIKDSVSAKELWKRILTNYFEAGLPFLCFKDSANRANPNGHCGIIRSSNLCTEIFQNTESSHYKAEVEFEDGSKVCYEERDLVKVDSGEEKPANKLTATDSINEKKVFINQRISIDGNTAVCNLASINLSKINKKEDIQRVVPIAIRMLDNVIDLNFYPNRKVKATNILNRAIGLGIMGEAEMLASQFIAWGSEEHLIKIDEIMEEISYNAISSSADLSIEKGAYPQFEGSNWSKGIFPIDLANREALSLVDRGGLFGSSCDWDGLREKVKKSGMRNGYLMAIAPTSSISILAGTTQTIEPVYKRKWLEENLSGLIPVVAPNLTLETWSYYKSAYDIDQMDVIRAASVRQKWIDQGQSVNIFMSLDKASGKIINDIYFLAWKLGLKSTYYLRSESPDAEEMVADRSVECYNCQ